MGKLQGELVVFAESSKLRFLLPGEDKRPKIK